MNATAGVSDGWSWWQARRLRYNIALAASGMAAYLLSILISLAYGEVVFSTIGEAAGQTLFLGALFLIVMGIANVCYLVGPFGEAWLRPHDLERYRQTAHAMGFWGSAALPFLVPLINLSTHLS